MAKIFGEEHFIDKEMITIVEQRNNAIEKCVIDGVYNASFEIGVIVNKEKLKRWLDLCAKLENISETTLIDIATKKKFADQVQTIAEQQVEIKELKKQVEEYYDLEAEYEYLKTAIKKQNIVDFNLQEEIQNLKKQVEEYQDMEFAKEHCDLYAENELLKKQLENAIVPLFKVGQKFYYINYQHDEWQIFDGVYNGENSSCVISDFCGYYHEYPKENVFATEEEAQARLEELRKMY